MLCQFSGRIYAHALLGSFAMSRDLLQKSALELAALVREKQLSCEELVGASLSRIAEDNPRLQAFVTVFESGARRAAKKHDALLKKADPASLPPFFGLPMGIKDVNLCVGESEAAGVPMLMGARAKEMLLLTKAIRGGQADFTEICRVVEDWAGVVVESKSMTLKRSPPRSRASASFSAAFACTIDCPPIEPEESMTKICSRGPELTVCVAAGGTIIKSA